MSYAWALTCRTLDSSAGFPNRKKSSSDGTRVLLGAVAYPSCYKLVRQKCSFFQNFEGPLIDVNHVQIDEIKTHQPSKRGSCCHRTLESWASSQRQHTTTRIPFAKWWMKDSTGVKRSRDRIFAIDFHLTRHLPLFVIFLATRLPYVPSPCLFCLIASWQVPQNTKKETTLESWE